MAYTRVNWEDLPSTNTAINAENLNKMDLGIFNLDNNKADITYVDDYTDGTKPMGSIVVDNVSCKNMLNPYTFINGNISNTGSYQANTVNYLSDYIEVKPNTQYIASANISQPFFQISEWTNNKTFIKRTALQDTATNTITTTATTKYVRISYNKDNTTAMTQDILLGFEPQFELGEERTTYTPYKNFDNTGYTLYQDAGNGNNGTITLSDSLDNYSYYEIFYQRSTSSAIAGYTSAKFNKTGNISFTNSYIGSTNAYYHSSVYSANGTSLTPTYYFSIQWVKASGNQSIITDTNYTYITKVIGYK